MEKVKNILHKIEKFDFIIEFVIAIIFGQAIFNVVYIKKYFDIWNLKDIIISGITIFIIGLIVINNIIHNKEKLEKVFIAISIPLAICYSIFVIITYVPDEQSHIHRAFNIGRGNFIISTEQNLESIPKYFSKIETANNYKELVDLKATVSKEDKEECQYFNAFVTYFPSIYIGPSIGSFIAEIVNMDVISSVYFMRIINVIIYLILGYFTIRWIPFGKLMTMTYLCLPMLIHQGASASADCFINAMALLFIAYNLKLLVKKEKYSKKEKVIYVILALLSTLNKTAYIPLIFLAILLIFRKTEEKNKSDKVFLMITMIVMIAISAVWYLYTSNYQDVRENIVRDNVSASNQIEFIKSNPIAFMGVLKNTFINRTTNYLYQALGQFLGRLSITIDSIIPTIFLGMIMFAAFLEDTKISFSKYQKIFTLLLVAGMILLVELALYLTWTPPGGAMIEGVQGRYFLPFLLLAFLCIVQKGKSLYFKYTIQIYSALIIILNTITLITVAKSFL